MKIVTFLLGCLTATTLLAQPCATGRYATDVYPNVTTTSDITFGQNNSWSGAATTLKLDFYSPTGDTAQARPLIIWVHGGSFIGGSKTDIDVATFSQRFAKKGYACASIDYRVGFFPFDSANAVKAVVRAVQDLKSAIRYFYKDAATANMYKIDTNHIFIGGSSAGAITALHVAYLNDACEISAYLNGAAIQGLGGLEGTSGNPGYSTKVHAVISGCGALARYSWLEAGDIPLCSVHGTNDGTVLYNRGVVNPGVPLMYLDGSRMLHERACAVGVENQFYTFPNAPHVPYAGTSAAAIAYMDTTVNFVRDFLVKQLGCTDAPLQPENARQQAVNLYAINYCDGSPVNEVCTTSGVDALAVEQLSIYPNPSSESMTISWEGNESMKIELFDFSGRRLNQMNVNGTQCQLSRNGVNNGTYLLIFTTASGEQFSRTILFN